MLVMLQESPVALLGGKSNMIWAELPYSLKNGDLQRRSKGKKVLSCPSSTFTMGREFVFGGRVKISELSVGEM